MDIWSHWGWPALTAIVGLVYVGLLIAQYRKRRKLHQIMWAIGFLIYAVAAGMESWSEFSGTWDQTVYRVYIVLAATMVGFLGNGTLYLITKKKTWGNAYLILNLVLIAVFFWGVFTTPLDTSVLKAGITVGGKPLGSGMAFPRVMSLFFNIPGTLLLVGGSAMSVVKFWPKKEYRYRSWANVLIIVGTLMIAGAGSMARAGITAGLYPAEMAASAVLLWGFLMASTLEKGARAVKAKRESAPAGDQSSE